MIKRIVRRISGIGRRHLKFYNGGANYILIGVVFGFVLMMFFSNDFHPDDILGLRSEVSYDVASEIKFNEKIEIPVRKKYEGVIVGKNIENQGVIGDFFCYFIKVETGNSRKVRMQVSKEKYLNLSVGATGSFITEYGHLTEYDVDV